MIEQQIKQAIENKSNDEVCHCNNKDCSCRAAYLAGSNYLLPLLLKAIEQRDFESGAGAVPSEKYNKELLKLLGEL